MKEATPKSPRAEKRRKPENYKSGMLKRVWTPIEKTSIAGVIYKDYLPRLVRLTTK